MSQDQSYWSSAFKLTESQYENNQWRYGPISRKFTPGHPDPHDFPIEGSSMSHRGYARAYRNPYLGMQYPRECAKLIGQYYDCRIELGVRSIVDPSPLQCNGKKAKVFEDCPHWVLENMAYKVKYIKRAEAIDKITYDRAMEVSDYNK